MNVLVTGASGFIGHHVAQALFTSGLRPLPLIRQGSDVTGLEAHAQGFRHADLRDEEALRRAAENVDAVVHLAGLTRARSLDEFLEVNAGGVRRLVRAVRAGASASFRRFVLVSSLAAGGPGVPTNPRKETDPDEPVTPYGVSKLAGERVLREEAVDLPWTIVRPPIVYGPREKDLLQVFQLCRKGLVPVVGFRDKHYSMVYAPDLAEAIVDLIGHEDAVGRTFNVAEERTYTYRELVRVIGEAVGRVPPMPRVPHLIPRVIATLGTLSQPFRRRPPFVSLSKLPEILAPGWVCSTDAVRSLLPSVASTSLADGARATVEWYRGAGWI